MHLRTDWSCRFLDNQVGRFVPHDVEVDDRVEVHDHDHNVKGVDQPEINHFEVRSLKIFF